MLSELFWWHERGKKQILFVNRFFKRLDGVSLDLSQKCLIRFKSGDFGGQHVKRFFMFLKTFLKHFGGKARYIIFAKTSIAIREYCCHKGCDMVCNNV